MKIVSHSLAQTYSIGRKISRRLAAGDIICLVGCLGSGKTALAKGICEGLGIEKREVISPTFVLLRNYEGRVPVYHFDLYRMEKADDVLGLGMDEYLYGEGVSIIEWADRLGFLTPDEFLKIELSVRPGTQRQLSFTAVGKRYAKIQEQVHEDIGG